jgi:hypothetical protein
MSTFRLPICLLVIAVALAACSSAPPAGSPTAPPAQSTVEPTDGPTDGEATTDAAPTPGTMLTACDLVAPSDIEAALELDAGTVAQGQHTDDPTVLDPARNKCRYDDDWGGLVIEVLPTDGVNAFDAVADTFGDDAEDLPIGDGALWFEDNNRGYFLNGSVMVLLQFTHLTDSDSPSRRDLTVALGEAALAKLD